MKLTEYQYLRTVIGSSIVTVVWNKTFQLIKYHFWKVVVSENLCYRSCYSIVKSDFVNVSILDNLFLYARPIKTITNY